MKNNYIRYGGTVADKREENAIMQSVRESIATGNWQAGKQAALLEKETAKFLGVKHGILTTSGSCAGLLALAALELPPGSEVIIPAVTFPTIFNIILQCGLTPVVVDSKIGTYTLDVEELKDAVTDKTKAIIAVHALGNPVDMPKLMAFAKKHNLYVIEDNCDGWGTVLNGRPIGSFGDLSITSFHAAHIVSMGVGGGVYTNDTALARNVRMYRDWGRQADVKVKKNGKKWKTLPEDYDSRFIYEKIGYNFQILELQAAMGRVQLKKAGMIKRKRKANFNYLYKHLAKFNDLILPIWDDQADICWFSFPITAIGERAPLIDFLEKHNIETRSMFAGNILRHPAYEKVRAGYTSLSEANYILEHSFWIGVHPRMTQEDREYIISVFEKYYAQASERDPHRPNQPKLRRSQKSA